MAINHTVMTPGMVASTYHLTERWLARRRNERNGPVYMKVGKRILYRVEDIERYLADAKVEARV